MKQTILIVDDEEDILDLLEYTLTKANYDVISCVKTTNIQQILDEEEVSLIIMDRNLPDIEGSIFVKKLKKLGYNTPVIFLSAKDSSEDILDGFSCGADDYITKPFNLDELKARVQAVLRRTSSTKQNNKLIYKDIVYDKAKKLFAIDNNTIDLTLLEHDLLLEFIKNKNNLLTREYLLDTVWKDGDQKQTKTVNVAIKRLKEKIDPTNTKNYIKTKRGQGYILC